MLLMNIVNANNACSNRILLTGSQDTTDSKTFCVEEFFDMLTEGKPPLQKTVQV